MSRTAMTRRVGLLKPNMNRKYHTSRWTCVNNVTPQIVSGVVRRFVCLYVPIICIIIPVTFAAGQQVASDLPSEGETSKSVQASTEQDVISQAGYSEDSEICRLVLKIEFSRTSNSAVSRLRADIAAGVYAEYAISERRGRRLKKSPKISVPVGRNRYRVWYGYSGKIREAVLATAAAQPTVKKKPSEIAQVAYAEEAETKSVNTGTKYPHRASWWTVGKRYPDREAMVKHLSSGQHKGVFLPQWLATLSRDELHALHSDDHEKKVDWTYAVRAEEALADPVLSEN